MAKKKTFEESIQTLEEIVLSLEKDEITLEDSIKKYKEGIQLINNCNEAIDRIEKELKIVDDQEA